MSLNSREKDRIKHIAESIFGKIDTKEEGDILFLTLQPDVDNELFFDRFYDSIKNSGYICFMSEENEIGVMRRDKRVNNNVKLLLLILTILSIIYAGFAYSSSYYSGSTASEALFASIIYFAIPIFTIFLVREIPKVIVHRRSGIPYSIPIFVPNPISMGTMGLINAPEVPYKNRNDMIVSSSLSLIFGFVAAMIFYIAGIEDISYAIPVITSVNIPAHTISSPLLFQFIILRYLPIQGNLDPLAYAGWVGMIFTSFNAFPIGFLDGGVIMAINNQKLKRDISYISLFAMVAFSLTFPSWLILPVFILLMGVNAPMSLNHLQAIRTHSKALAVSVIFILFIGIVPYPFHTTQSSFTMNVPDNSGLIINNTSAMVMGGSATFSFVVKNSGPTPIEPAFSISPSTPFNVTGYETTLSPGAQELFSITIDSASVNNLGINNYQVSVTTGQFTRSTSIEIYKLALSKTMDFNSANPYISKTKGNSSANLTFYSLNNQSIAIYLIGPGNMSYMASVHGSKAKETGTYLLTVSGTEITGGSTENVIITPLKWSGPFQVIAVNQTWSGAVAFVEPGS
jgi:hypothetical protein